MKNEPTMDCPLTPYIKNNVKIQIKRLREDGITAMGMNNLFHVTKTPPQHLAIEDESNIINYRPTFERLAAEVAAELNFPILAERRANR